MSDELGMRQQVRLLIVIGLLFVVCGIVGGYLWNSGGSDIVEPASPVVKDTKGRPKRVLQRDVARPLPVAPQPADIEIKETPERRALEVVAETSGAGVVDCALPMGAPSGIPRDLPRAQRHGNVLTLFVEDAVGRASLFRPKMRKPTDGDSEAYFEQYFESLREPPFGVAVWKEAHPGETGTCWVEESRKVTVHGRVEDAVAGQVNGCGGKGRVAEDGTFSFEINEGGPCELSFNSTGMGEGVVIRPDALPAEVVLVRPGGGSATERMTARLDSLREEAQRLAEMADPIEVALETPDLDDETRAVLKGWSATEKEERTQRIETLIEQADFFEAAGRKHSGRP